MQPHLIFQGTRVILNANMTKPGPMVEMFRSWGERLFTRPWQPLRKFRYVQSTVADDTIIKMEVPVPGMLEPPYLVKPDNPPRRPKIPTEKVIVMHPETWGKIEQALRKEGRVWEYGA